MRWLLFLSRLAFLCNVFFLLALSLQLVKWMPGRDAEATVIVLGYVMAAALNPVANLCYLLVFFTRRAALQVVPRWLLWSNFVFLILQIAYIIYLNGTKHPEG